MEVFAIVDVPLKLKARGHPSFNRATRLKQDAAMLRYRNAVGMRMSKNGLFKPINAWLKACKDRRLHPLLFVQQTGRLGILEYDDLLEAVQMTVVDMLFLQTEFRNESRDVLTVEVEHEVLQIGTSLGGFRLTLGMLPVRVITDYDPTTRTLTLEE